jgi:hypothetical protein
MLKIEAIKSTWDTLSKEDQLSLLKALKFQTLGLCKETVLDSHPSKHIFDICGHMPFREYEKVLIKYEKLIENVVSGKILASYNSCKSMDINMSTKRKEILVINIQIILIGKRKILLQRINS